LLVNSIYNTTDKGMFVMFYQIIPQNKYTPIFTIYSSGTTWYATPQSALHYSVKTFVYEGIQFSTTAQ